MLTIAIMLPFAESTLGYEQTKIDALIADTATFILDNVTEPGIGQIGGDWAVIALLRSGADVSDEYIRCYYNNAIDRLIASGGVLSTTKYSDYSRVTLGMAAIGADPTNLGGYDLIAPLLDFDTTIAQGINGPIFALIALEATNRGNENIKEQYLEYILSKQLSDGGFTLSGTNSDPDTTGMALTALSAYSDRPEIEEAVGLALARLSRIQRETGGFTSFMSTNSESVSQAIIALCSLGIPIDDNRFVKDGYTLYSNLMTYYVPGNGFEHEIGGGVSLMATEQALCALAAIRRAETDRPALFDMVDAPIFVPDELQIGLDSKHPDVSVPIITTEEPQFNDINGHEYENAIVALYQREIINGYSPESFMPDGTIKRSEFAAIIIRTLGLSFGNASITFEDVPVGSWFYDFARTAVAYGIIYGRNDFEFDPDGLITRQEAALMVMRAALLCGLNIELDDVAIRNILSPFGDYRSAAPWATEALAFCCYFGMIDDLGILLRPNDDMLRGETADMVYKMLHRAKLLSS